MRTLNDYFISGRVADISTAGSTFVAVPDGGRIIKIMTVLQGAISGGNAAITFEIGGTAVTGAGFTVAHSGSAVGTMDGSVPTALNRVEEDGTIEEYYVMHEGYEVALPAEEITVLKEKSHSHGKKGKKK